MRGAATTKSAFIVTASPRRWFRRAVVVALALHLPLVPTPLTAIFDRLLEHRLRDYEDADAGIVIPVDLDLVDEPSVAANAPEKQPAGAPSPGAPAASAAPEAEAVAKKAKKNEADAGAPREEADAGPPPVKDPLAMAGAVGKLAAKDANVQIYVASDRLRRHELALAFAKMLVNLPEWSSFFAGSGIDPLRDFDHVLVAGPRLKQDSSKMVAIAQYHVTTEAMHDAIDAIVARTQGSWIEGAPIPAARAEAAGAKRIFALVEKKHLLAILPAEAEDRLAEVEKTRGFAPSSRVGIAVAMVNPSRPLGAVLPLPSSLTAMRLALMPRDDGGADLRVEFTDAAPDDAEKDAKVIEEAYDKARRIEIPIFGAVEALDRGTFTTKGKTIRVEVTAREGQLRQILAFAGAKYGGAADAGVAPAAAPGNGPAPAPSP